MRWHWVNSSRALCWLGGVLFLLWCAGVVACPRAGVLPKDAVQAQALAERLSPQLVACERDASFLAWYGAVLRQAQRYPEAAVWLERALLLEPNLLGAQLDYADTLAALAEWPSARSLWEQLRQRPDLPAHVQQALEARLSAWNHIFLPLRRTHWAVKVGRDSNLTSAPRADQLALTLPSGEISLPLSENFRPHAGNVLLLEAGFDYTFARDEQGQQWQGYTDVRVRHSPSLVSAQYQQLDMGLLAARDQSFHGVYLTQLTANGETLYQSVRINRGWQWQQKTCPLSANIELDWRRYPSAVRLDNLFWGVGLAGGCAMTSTPMKFALRLGQERDYRSQRLGGDSWRLDTRLEKQWEMARGYLLTDVSYSWQQDSKPYSALLAHGAKRAWQRGAVKLEYVYPLSQTLAVSLSAEKYTQRANIDLFTTAGHAWYVGLRYDKF